MSERRYLPKNEIRIAILNFIEKFQAKHHRAPTGKEIMYAIAPHNTRVYDMLRYLKLTHQIVLRYEIRK